MNAADNGDGPRCLIVERHEWETGGGQQQLQLVLRTAEEFFGSGDKDRTIQLRFFMPADAKHPLVEKDIVISRQYKNGTRRTNKFAEMGSLRECFVFFQETGEPDVFDFWWQTDKAIVAARYKGWQKGRNTQYGRGRLSLVVRGRVPRVIDEL